MMLNGYGAARQAVAPKRQPEDDEDSERAPDGRRSTARTMAMGAPLSASFLGLLLAGGSGQTAAAGQAAEAGEGSAAAAGEALRGDAATVAGRAAAGAVPASDGAPVVAIAAAGAAAAAVTGESGTAAAPTGELAVVAAGPDGLDDGPSAATAPDAETVPPAAPDIGGVTLAFGSEAPFVMPDLGGDTPGSRDENLGNIGDPGAIVREPIVPPGEDQSEDQGAGGGGGAAGNPGLRITGTADNDTLIGTDGDDIIDAVGGKNTVLGGAGDDLIYGGTGNDVLRGGPGNDTIYGRAGNNIIYGDEGDNQLFGGTGNDKIYGGSGTDRLDGVAGSNELYAGTGDSTLVINSPSDMAFGNDSGPNGGGTDTLEVAAGFAASLRGRFSPIAPDGQATFVMSKPGPGLVVPEEINRFGWHVDPRIENVRLTGDDDHDVLGSARNNTIWGNEGNNRLYGGDGDDILHAGGGDNRLDGGAGNDHLHAGSGNDRLFGGPGDDVLYGGSGESELHGGEGDDLYVFGLAEGGRSTVFDHEGINRLRFDGLERPEDLEGRMEGDDLVLAHNGADIVRLDSFAGQRDAFAGVEWEGEVLSLDQFIRDHAASPVATAAADVDDLLALYLGPQSVEADDILDPAWLDADGPGHDAPFALYETSEASDLALAGRAAADGEVGPDDVLGGFMRSESLWIGPEDGLYVPDAPELHQAEPLQARG